MRGRSARALALVLLVGIVSLVAVAGGSATPSRSKTSSVVNARIKPPPRSPVDRFEARHRKQARARMRRLRTPAARAARRRSRHAYRRVSSKQALAVARAKVHDVIAGESFRGPDVGPGGKLERYLGDNAALVVDAAGRR